MTMGRMMVAALLLGSLAACGGGKSIAACDDAKKYELVVEGKRVEVPDGLDELDEFKEMTIPKAETGVREEDAGCIEKPPPILIES